MSAARDSNVGDLEPDPSDCGFGGRGWGGRCWWVPILAAVGVVAALAVVARFERWPQVPGPFPAFWPFVPFGFLAVFVLIALLVRSFAWRYGPRWSGPRSYAVSADEIVRRRYACGEITAEQLREMLRELDGSPS